MWPFSSSTESEEAKAKKHLHCNTLDIGSVRHLVETETYKILTENDDVIIQPMLGLIYVRIIASTIVCGLAIFSQLHAPLKDASHPYILGSIVASFIIVSTLLNMMQKYIEGDAILFGKVADSEQFVRVELSQKKYSPIIKLRVAFARSNSSGLFACFSRSLWSASQFSEVEMDVQKLFDTEGYLHLDALRGMVMKALKKKSD